MIEYAFIAIAFLIIISSAFLINKFFFKPLFFPNYFPKDEVLKFLTTKNLYFISYKKVKVNTFKENLEEDMPLLYRISFFEVESQDKEGNIKRLKVEQSKSNSIFHKGKIEFYFE